LEWFIVTIKNETSILVQSKYLFSLSFSKTDFSFFYNKKSQLFKCNRRWFRFERIFFCRFSVSFSKIVICSYFAEKFWVGLSNHQLWIPFKVGTCSEIREHFDSCNNVNYTVVNIFIQLRYEQKDNNLETFFFNVQLKYSWMDLSEWWTWKEVQFSLNVSVILRGSYAKYIL
jgi:hypothetical protein